MYSAQLPSHSWDHCNGWASYLSFHHWQKLDFNPNLLLKWRLPWRRLSSTSVAAYFFHRRFLQIDWFGLVRLLTNIWCCPQFTFWRRCAGLTNQAAALILLWQINQPTIHYGSKQMRNLRCDPSEIFLRTYNYTVCFTVFIFLKVSAKHLVLSFLGKLPPWKTPSFCNLY